MRTRSVALALVILSSAGVISVVMRNAPELPGIRMAVAAAPANGLTGHYYSRHLDKSAGGIDYAGLYGLSFDEFGLPVTRRAADAMRIDSQIAFARPRVARYDKGIPPLEWWAPSNVSAVVWKGYFRLPKPGTYYVTTVSQGASSVYLNKARVALNGPFGGAIREDAFTYGDVGAPDVSSYATGHYAVPVTVRESRDLPLEVRYAFHAVPWIDLYWVTPDSPRDAAGKPIAEIIPATALFVDAPEPIAEAQVSGPHSTISSDVLYLDTKADSLATLTIRVADKQGRPLSGQRVHVANLASYGFKDTVLQPASVTNEHGIATAQVKPYAVGHTAKFFATVLDEVVDVGQVAEVEIFQAGNLALLPRGFAPYYSESFTISPKPLVVSQKTTITVPVGNPLKVPLELSVRFLNSIANIGGSDWTRIGETDKVVLKPGESRAFSIAWTPQKEEGHLCFAVEVWGRELPQQAKRENPFTLFVSAHAQTPATPAPASGGSSLMDRRQQNIGPVSFSLMLYRKGFSDGGPWETVGDWEDAEDAKGRGIEPIPRLTQGQMHQRSGSNFDKPADGDEDKPTKWVINPKTGKPMQYWRQQGPGGEFIYGPRPASVVVRLSRFLQEASAAVVGEEKGQQGPSGGDGDILGCSRIGACP